METLQHTPAPLHHRDPELAGNAMHRCSRNQPLNQLLRPSETLENVCVCARAVFVCGNQKKKKTLQNLPLSIAVPLSARLEPLAHYAPLRLRHQEKVSQRGWLRAVARQRQLL